MTKINRQDAVTEALRLLDEVGLDGVSTRRLAQRLGVEQPALYWHFAGKHDLLTAMATAAMAPHTDAPPPQPGDDWQDWFRENFRRFRRTLLMHRDGARLHAGTTPSAADLELLAVKLEFLRDHGIPPAAVQAAMMTGGQFTVGNALEAQAAAAAQGASGLGQADYADGFEAGLELIVAGLSQQIREGAPIAGRSH